MTASDLRLASRQRHIDPAKFVNWKRLTDLLNSSEPAKDFGKSLLLDAEDLEVEIAGVTFEQPIAHEAANGKGTAAVVVYQARNCGRVRDKVRGHVSFWRTRAVESCKMMARQFARGTVD
jgi:hypothetical protein